MVKSLCFFQSSERLIDGRKTPDYALYSELFTPELARQIVLGKRSWRISCDSLFNEIPRMCHVGIRFWAIRLEYEHKCIIVVKFFLPAFLSEYWLFHYGGGRSEWLPRITLECLYSIDQITIKTPNPECRLFWCSIEFIGWRYSQSYLYFRPLL
jgi:hypothetical protein